MAERLNDAARNRQADHVGDDFNSGTLKIYTGSQPAAGGSATGTLLSTINLPADAMAAASAGVAAKQGTWSDSSAAATGTAGWFRIESSAGTRWYDGAVGGSGSGAELELASTSITATQVVTVTAFTVTQPAS